MRLVIRVDDGLGGRLHPLQCLRQSHRRTPYVPSCGRDRDSPARRAGSETSPSGESRSGRPRRTVQSGTRRLQGERVRVAPRGGLRGFATLAQGGQGRVFCSPCVSPYTKTGSSGGRNLSYSPMKYGRDDWIRTSDPLTPSHRVVCFLPLSPHTTYSDFRQKHQHLHHIILSSVFMAFHSSPVYSVTPA